MPVIQTVKCEMHRVMAVKTWYFGMRHDIRFRPWPGAAHRAWQGASSFRRIQALFATGDVLGVRNLEQVNREIKAEEKSLKQIEARLAVLAQESRKAA
jgi:hypothetical protein